MKTVNSFPKRLAAAFVFILAATSFLTACPGNKGGDGVPVSAFGACVSCAGIASPTALIPQATSTSTTAYFPATISWQVLGDANIIAQTQAMYGPYYQAVQTAPWSNYRGSIIVRGGITLNSQVIAGAGGGYYPYAAQQVPYGQPYGAINGAAGQCVIPAGAYTFDTITAGMMQQGDFYVQDLQAIGPVQFHFQLRAQANRPYGAAMDQIYARIQIISVNGAPCTSTTFSLY